MKVKMLISMLVAGFLATSIGYAAGEDNAATDSSTAMSGSAGMSGSSMSGSSTMSGTGEMGTMSGTQNDNSATQDTTTSDEDY